MKLQEGVRAAAVLSPDKAYRYVLRRCWLEGCHEPGVEIRGRHALWVMLNPSTATAEEDDATIRKCQAFARQWGLDGIVVVNLFALRSTDPRALRRHPDPVGPSNDGIIRTMAAAPYVEVVVGGWGADPLVAETSRGRVVGDLVASAGRDLHCLRRTKTGEPGHPLYIPYTAGLQVWKAAG